MKDKQMIWDIKKFEDIIFTIKKRWKRTENNSYQATLWDDKGYCLLSIIYGEIALYGAQHGLGKYDDDDKPEDDMGYEIEDNIGDDINMKQNDNYYVISKKDLMAKIKDSAKYEYRWEEFEDIDDNSCQIKGIKIHKIKRKVGK